MSAVTERSSSYGRTFGVGAVLVLVLATLAAVNVYTNLAPEMGSSQQSMLLSGLVAILLVVTVALLFVATIIGRERTAAVATLAAQARQIEQGELDIDLATNRTDDVGDIYRALAVLRDSEQLDRQRGVSAEVVAQYCETAAEISNGDDDSRLEENVDDPQLAELAMRFNEILDQRKRDAEIDSR